MPSTPMEELKLATHSDLPSAKPKSQQENRKGRVVSLAEGVYPNRDEVARIGDEAIVADVHPGAAEDPIHFQVENVPVEIERPMHMVAMNDDRIASESYRMAFSRSGYGRIETRGA